MAPIATLTVRISAQIAELQKSFADASKSTKDFQDGFESVATRAATAGALIGNIFTKIASSVASGVGASISGTIALGGALADLSAKTGITIKALQEFKFAGERVGVSLDDISTAVLQMQKQLEGGGKPVAAALQTIGLSLKDLQGLKPEEQFRKIAAALAQIQDPALRNKTAFDIMGKAAASVLPLISSNLAEATDKAHKLGVVLDDQTVAALDNLGDTFGDLKLSAQALFAKGLAPLLPMATNIAQALANMPAPLQAATAGVAAFAAIVAPLGLALGGITSGFTSIVGAVTGVVGALRSVTSAFTDGTKAVYDFVTASKNVKLDQIGAGAPGAAKNVYAVATALGALLVALHEVQGYIADKFEGREITWWETLFPPVAFFNSAKGKFNDLAQGIQTATESFSGLVLGNVAQQYGGVVTSATAAGAAIGGTAGPTKTAAAAMSELARLNKQYSDDLSSKGLQAFKDAATLHDRYGKSIEEAAKEYGLADSSLKRYIDEQSTAAAGTKRLTEETKRLTDADKKWRDQVTGGAASHALEELTRRWDRLSDADKKNQRIVAAVVSEYETLRPTLSSVGGELEALRNTTLQTIPTNQRLEQSFLLWGNAALDASKMADAGAAALQGFQRNGNLVSHTLVDMAVQMKAVPFDVTGTHIKLLAGTVEETFHNLALDLPNVIADALISGVSVFEAVGREAGGRFVDAFLRRVAESQQPGGTPLTGGEKAMGMAGVGLQGFFGGFDIGASQGKTKGALGGAATGAMSGFMVGGPIGAAVGGIAGFVGGLFGGSKKAKEERAELEKNQQALLEQYGGMQKLQKLAQSLGVDIQKAFDAKHPEQFTAAVNELNKALDDQKTRMDGLNTAIEGLNTRAGIFADKFQAILDAKPPEGADTEAFNAGQLKKLTALAAASGDEFDRLGLIARDTFAGLVKETGNGIEAMQLMAPTFQTLQDGVEKFGLTGSAVTQELIDNFKLVNDTAFKPLFDTIVADGQVLRGLFDAKALSPEGFQALATDIGTSIQGVIDKGGDMARTLALSQPVLQTLWEAQQQYGAVTDETTAAILKQAESQGLVGDQFKETNEKILDVLLAIGKVLGADLPQYFEQLKNPADAAAQDVEQAFAKIDIKPIEVPYVYIAQNELPGGVDIPKLASGGIVTRPTVALIGEGGPEAVVPLTGNALGLTPQSYETNIYLDGERIARSTAKRLPGVLKGVGVGN